MTVAKQCFPEPLTVNLGKRLECGHERVDFSPMKIGRSVHCTTCRDLRDVVDVFVPAGVKLGRFDRERLEAAGYTRDEIRRMASRVGR